MRKLPTYPILLAVMLVCIAAKVGYASAYYYDYRGRTVHSVEANRLGGYDRTTTGYDYVGNPIFTELTHSTAADPTGIRQQWEREYDRQGRELTVRHRLGGGQWTTLSAKEYDPLGRLQSETAGITSTYAYDIRSRQTSITSDRYNQWLDFTPGGNVTRMKWRTKWLGEYDRTYDFDYDGLSRLTAATYNDSGGNAGHYNTSYSYDLNGNVTSLDRRGIVDPDADRKDGFIDRLTYEYRGNKVTRIIDDAPALTYQGAYDFVDGADEDVEYAYDASGNTVSDLNRGIVRITYDVNHRPRTIGFSNGAQTRYIYDAQGRKLRTEHSVPSLQPTLPGVIDTDQPLETTATDYCGQVIYEDGVLDRINLDGGYLSYHTTSGLRLTTPEYHFYQRDHLGNNRVDIPSSGGVSQVTNYYPFGLPMYAGFGRERQRWKFGGKELDRVNGLDLYDFEARAYDPCAIIWRSPDAFCEIFQDSSPFGYGKNNPMRIIDPTGLFATESEAQEYADENFPGAEVHIDNVSQQWFVALNEQKTGPYESGGVITRDFGPNNPYAMPIYPINIGISAWGVANSTKLELMKYGTPIEKSGPVLGKYMNGVKWAGYIGAGANILYAGYNMVDYTQRGGKNKWVYVKYIGDIAVSVIAATVTGPVLTPVVICGVLIYFISDIATDGFGIDYSTPAPIINK